MQFTKKQISCFLLILIGLSAVSSTSLNAKRKRKMEKSFSENDDVTEANTTEGGNKVIEAVQKHFEDKAKGFKNKMYFVMGFLSNWFPKLKKIYSKISAIDTFFNACKDTASTIWKEINNISENKKNNEEMAKMLKKDEEGIEEAMKKNKNEKQADKDKMCITIKKFFNEMYVRGIDHTHRNNKALRDKLRNLGEAKNKKENKDQYSLKVDEFCLAPIHALEEEVKAKGNEDADVNNIRKDIIYKFETLEDYEKVCREYREKSCTGYNPKINEGAFAFIKKTAKYAGFVIKASKCVIGSIKLGGGDDALKQLAKDVFSGWEVTKSILKEVGSFVLHFFTAGIWGAIRHIYAMIKLTLILAKMAVKFDANLPFHFGQVVGLGVVAVKALVFGRRRR